MVAANRRVAYTSPSGIRDLDFGGDYYIIPGQQVAENAAVVFGGPAGQPAGGLAQVARGNVVVFT